jgi:hypothetical protein
VDLELAHGPESRHRGGRARDGTERALTRSPRGLDGNPYRPRPHARDRLAPEVGPAPRAARIAAALRVPAMSVESLATR